MIDFSLTPQQLELRGAAREFALRVLQPVAVAAEREADPQKAFAMTRDVYRRAWRQGFVTGFLPQEYGGRSWSHLDLVIASEELSAVDPGFATTLLVNGLALMPVFWWGNDDQKRLWSSRLVQCENADALAGWVVSERGGSANFDHPHPAAGLQLTATPARRGGGFTLNGEKHWPCNAGGWDLGGADFNLCIARIHGGGLGAFIVERGSPGVTYEVIDKGAHRTGQNVTMTFRNVHVDAPHCLAAGEGDLLISRNFTWSGPLAGIASVGVARAAFDFTLQWARTYTAGGTSPILYSPVVGAMLVDIAAKIEAARAFCWKAAHYIDRHEGAAHGIAAMSKSHVSESMLQVVIDCMRVVGVNALDRRFPLERLYREAMVFPLYDAGNIGMQRRRAWGVIADPRYVADHYVAAEPFDFDRSMHGLGFVGSATGFRPG